MLSSIGVTAPLHIPYVPYITALTNISTASASNEKHSPTY